MSNIFLLAHPVMHLQKAWIIIRQRSSEEHEFPLKTWKLQESLCLIWLIQPHKNLNLFLCLFHKTDFLFQIIYGAINKLYVFTKKQRSINSDTSLPKQVPSPDCWLGRWLNAVFRPPSWPRVRCISLGSGLPWLTPQKTSGVWFSCATTLWNSKTWNCIPMQLHSTEKLCDLAKPRREHKYRKITTLIGGRRASEWECLRSQITFSPY